MSNKLVLERYTLQFMPRDVDRASPPILTASFTQYSDVDAKLHSKKIIGRTELPQYETVFLFRREGDHDVAVARYRLRRETAIEEF